MILRILLALVVVSCATARQSHITIELSLAFGKPVYKVGEQITATLVFNNPGDEPINIAMSGANFRFWNGAEPIFQYRALINWGLHVITIEPGASHTRQLVFRDHLTHIPGSGTYDVRVVYQSFSSSFQGKTLWKGTIESKPVQVIIE
jgi:hypothetical protein